MRFLISSILTLLLSFSSSVLSETVDFYDLVERDGLLYKKFTDVPFTGEVEGEKQGRVKDGKKEGEWVWYYDNGQLDWKGTYRNGKKEGEWVLYHDNGQLSLKGTYRNGQLEGEWVLYRDNGQLWRKGTYRNGKKEGEWVRYGDDGQLWSKETYKNGVWVSD